MSDAYESTSDSEILTVGPLAPETARSLAVLAERNGRSVEEEVDHIIQTHLRNALAEAE